MDLMLRDAAVVITGGSRGIGRAIALAFAGEGARVAICGRDQDALAQTASLIRNADADCLTIRADLSNATDCQSVVDQAAAKFGRLGVLVNNASGNADKTPRSLEEASDDQIMARLNGKLLAAIRCSRAAIPHMRRIIEVDDIAPLVVFLASSLASAITGQAIAVDGGAARSIVY